MKSLPQPNRVELIDRSVRCFVLGLFSLLPIIGLPIAVMVLAMSWSVHRRARGIWNPAARYLRWGRICASWGAALSSFVTVVLGMIVAASTER